MRLNEFKPLHKKPSAQMYQTSNNRKLTLGRISVAKRIQSVPIYKENKIGGKTIKTFLGYRYIYH